MKSSASEPGLTVSNAWLRLNRGDNTRRTLVRITKRWPQPLVGGGLIYNDFNFPHFFETLITGWLIRWPFIGGSTAEMWLDLLYSPTLSGCSLDRCMGGRTSNKKMWLEQDTFREQFWELGFKIWWYCCTQWNCETQAQRSARGGRHDSKWSS